MLKPFYEIDGINNCNVLILYNEMCQYLEDLITQWINIFQATMYNVTKQFMGKVFKAQIRPMDFYVTIKVPSYPFRFHL